MIPKEISQQIILGLQGQFELMSKFGLRITPHAKTFVEPILSGDMTLKRITVGAANDEGAAAFEGIEIKAYDYRLPVIPSLSHCSMAQMRIFRALSWRCSQSISRVV
jgi:hypothetical protein